MANNLWRDQPSGRISTAGLLTKMTSGVSQLVASEFFEAPAQAGVTASVTLVEAADSLSSSGTVTSAPVLITVSLVEAGDSLASTGAALVGSTAAITEAADVLTVQSTVAVGATAALSQGADTVSSAALIAARCTAALIEANDCDDAVQGAKQAVFQADRKDGLEPNSLDDYALVVMFKGHHAPVLFGWQL